MYDTAAQNGVAGQFGQPSACRHLVRVSVALVDKVSCTPHICSRDSVQLEALQDWDGAVALLEECGERTRQSKAEDLAPLMDFRLGCAYEKINLFDKAVEVCRAAWGATCLTTHAASGALCRLFRRRAVARQGLHVSVALLLTAWSALIV